MRPTAALMLALDEEHSSEHQLSRLLLLQGLSERLGRRGASA